MCHVISMIPFAETSKRPLTHCPSFSHVRQHIASTLLSVKGQPCLQNCLQSGITPRGLNVGKTGALFQPNRSVFDRAINIRVENSSLKQCFMVPNNNTVYQSGPLRNTGGCRKQNVMGLGFVGETGA